MTEIMVENDNDADTGTNAGRVKREFYIVTLLGGFMCLGTSLTPIVLRVLF